MKKTLWFWMFPLAIWASSARAQVVTFAENFETGGTGVYSETDPTGAAAATLWHGEASCDGVTPIPATMGTNAAAYNQGDIAVWTYATGGTTTGCLESP